MKHPRERDAGDREDEEGEPNFLEKAARALGICQISYPKLHATACLEQFLTRNGVAEIGHATA